MARRAPQLVLTPCHAGDDPDDQLFARGFTEDLQAELARFRDLQLLCWSHPETRPDAAWRLPDGQASAFVLRTSFRRQGEAIRINASLIEAPTDRQHWSQRYDVDRRELLSVSDDIVAKTAAALSMRVEDAVLSATRGRPIENLEAYELWLRGKELLLRGTLADDEAARQMFRRALTLDADFPRAYAGLSLSFFNEWTCQHWNLWDEVGQKAYETAHKGLALDDQDPLLNIVVGRFLLYRREFEQAAWYVDRAQTLAPSNPDCLIQLSLCHAMLGRHEAGIEAANRAVRIHPFHPIWYSAYACVPFLLAKRIDDCMAHVRRAIEVPIVDLPAMLAICHAMKGELDEARRWYAAFEERFRTLITGGREPEAGEGTAWLLKVIPLHRADDVAFLREALGRIGRPSGDLSAVATAPDEAPPAAGVNKSAFLFKGSSWMLDFAGRAAILPDMKGLHDIATLLAQPGDAIHCFDLSEHVEAEDGGAPVLDEKARRAYGARIRDLQEEVADAEDANDTGRAERARAEMEALIEALKGSLGLGGRSRRLGSMAERARSTVTWRIRFAIRKVEAAHPALGLHLRKAVQTGTFCVYEPETPVRWQLAAKAPDGARRQAAG